MVHQQKKRPWMRQAMIVVLSLAGALPMQAIADQYEGEPITQVFERQGRDLRSESVLEHDLSTTIDRVTRTTVTDLEPVSDIECKSLPSDGKGDWKGFFNVPGSQKAQALSDAIRGLDPSTARRMIDSGFFHSKPRSWDAFKEEIYHAQSELGGEIAYRVLVRNGDENARNLGYAGGEDCQQIVRYVPVQHVVESRQPLRQVTRHFRLEIQDSPLLLGESERFTVAFDGLTDSLSVDSSYNSYQVEKLASSELESVYRLEGRRNLVTPSNALSAVARNENGNLAVDIRDALYESDVSQAMGESLVDIEVLQERTLWFPKSLGKIEARLARDGELTQVDTRLRPDPGKKVYVKFRVKRLGSRFFNNRESSSKSSNSVQF